MYLAVQSTRHLTRMVNSLLDVERLEVGKSEVDRRPTILSSLLADAADLLEIVTSDARQELIFATDETLPILALDSDMILRVVCNLVENAVKYTPEDGQIIVRAHVVGNEVQVSVSDSGPGIPPDMRDQIFDKYVRVRNKQMANGVGLGLAFCRMAVEAHGGRIWVETDPQIHGARFCFTLPLETQPTPTVMRTP
jgi:two-component system sensor histidine kinase KdpD